MTGADSGYIFVEKDRSWSVRYVQYVLCMFTRRPLFKCIFHIILFILNRGRIRDIAISLKFPLIFCRFPMILLRISEDSPENLPLIYLL